MKASSSVSSVPVRRERIFQRDTNNLFGFITLQNTDSFSNTIKHLESINFNKKQLVESIKTISLHTCISTYCFLDERQRKISMKRRIYIEFHIDFKGSTRC